MRGTPSLARPGQITRSMASCMLRCPVPVLVRYEEDFLVVIVVQESSSAPVFSFVDVFAGCGGLSLGLMQAGWSGLFAIEHDNFAFQTLRHNLLSPSATYRFQWPDWLPTEAADILDILRTKREHLVTLRGRVDMLVGGPPCQGFSAAGRRDANDPRNLLVQAYLKLVGILAPPIVLIENVRGIASDFEDHSRPGEKVNYATQLIEALSEEYFTSTNLINASEFGVPQRRIRVFIIALRRDVFPEGIDPFAVIDQIRPTFLRKKGFVTLPVTGKSAISDLEIGRCGRRPSRDTAGFEEIGYTGPRTSYQAIMNQDHSEFWLPDTRLARHAPEIADRFKRIIELCTNDGRLNTSLSSERRASLGLKKRATRVMDPDGPSPTVTSMPDDLIHYCEPRTLTVRENARLQSFPDWFAFQGKYTTGGHLRKKEVPRFTQVANAVPPLVAEAIGLAIADILQNVSSQGALSRPQQTTPRAAPQSREAES